MGDNKKIPEIRFKGFEREWEERKLGEISIKIIEKNSELKYFETFTNSAEFGIVLQRDYFDNDISNVDNIDKYFIVRENDFVYNPRISTFAPVGPINRNRLCRIGIMSPLYTVFKIQNTDYTFMDQFFKTKKWHPFMKLNGDTGARSDRFSIKDSLFFEMPISSPSKSEQSQIGSFFQYLDKQITLEQQKHDKLVTLKKAMLEKMFPKEGADVPEIRFKGFEGEWESDKMFLLADYSKGHSYTKNDLIKKGTPIILYGRLYTKYNVLISEVDTFALDKEGSLYSKGGEVIVPASGETAEDIAIASVVQNSGVIIGGDLNIISPYENINPIFLALSISYGQQHNELSKKAQGKSIVHLRNPDIKESTLIYPSKSEQSQIGNFFQNLDKLIFLQQQKTDKLKNIKKACLEKMFV